MNRQTVETYWPKLHEQIEEILMKNGGPEMVKFAPMQPGALKRIETNVAPVTVHNWGENEESKGLVSIALCFGKIQDDGGEI